MGQSDSKPERKEVPIEQLSHELALRFASKCYSHLEITHYKDNFKTLADHQGDIEFWKEETLCRFLALPDPVRAGSVLYAMTTYLGAFPFPSLAPCIVTREAMLKVITILTGRYQKVLKRGDQDKNKLLFRSLAVFDRRSSVALSPTTEEKMSDLIKEQRGDQLNNASDPEAKRSAGFDIDQPLDDEEDEDDDDLALAALDALDAIEVFKEDQKKDRKIHHAHIPMYNFQRLIMLLLLFAPVTPQDNIASVCGSVDQALLTQLEASSHSLLLSFRPEKECITYSNFMQTMTGLTPHLFRPLNPLFEHFLFSKQLDLTKHKDGNENVASMSHRRTPLCDADPSAILNDIHLGQLGASINITSVTASATSSFFHSGAKINQIYSTSSQGTSLNSFSRSVLSWKSSTIIVVKGTNSDTNQTHIIGAYLPDPWAEAGRPNDSDTEQASDVKAVMFQLQPRHAIFRSTPYNKKLPTSHFSTKTGISLGCIIPASSRVNAASQTPILGPVSLLIDEDMSTATFQHDGEAGTGAFMTDPFLEEAQRDGVGQAKKIELDLDGLEVWGVSFSGTGEEDAMTKQKKLLAWEDAEAARRKGVNFGGDKDGARHLLEMAGIIGDGADSRSGGSV